MDVDWKDICKKLNLKDKSQKLIDETVVNFYFAVESNIDTECNFSIFGIGSFKGTRRGINKERATKKHNRYKVSYSNKLVKRRQRYWAKEKIDDYWQQPNFQ